MRGCLRSTPSWAPGPPLAGRLQEERTQCPERGALGADAAPERLHVQDQVRIQGFRMRGVLLWANGCGEAKGIVCLVPGQRAEATSLTE